MPKLIYTIDGHVIGVPVKVPMIFPSNLVATESQSFSAMADATFLVIRWSFILSSGAAIDSRVMVLPTPRLVNTENIPPPLCVCGVDV